MKTIAHAILVAVCLAVGNIDTVEGGVNQWTSVGPNTLGKYRSGAIDPANPLRVYVTTTGLPGFWRTSDGGTSWEGIESGTMLEGAGSLYQVAVDAGNSLHLLVLSFSGVYRSSDGGDTWSGTAIPFSILNGSARAFGTSRDFVIVYVGGVQNCAPIFGDPGCSGGGVLKSTDGGITWEKTGLTNRSIVFVEVDPFDPNVVYAMSVDEPVYPTSGRGAASLFRTRDGGRTWTRTGPETCVQSTVNANSLDPLPSHILIDPVTPANLYLTCDTGLWTSVNGGDSWNLSQSAFPFTDIKALAVDPLHSQAFLAVTPVLGEPVLPPLPGAPPPPPPPNLFRIVRTTDQGQSWSAFIDGVSQSGVFVLLIGAERRLFYEIAPAGIFSYTITAVGPRRRAVRK